jgi:SulP family sulfate permease
VGSTFIKTIWTYSDSLVAQGGKLVLAGIDDTVRQRLDRTGFTAAIGAENIYPVTEQLGGPVNQALNDCRAWLEAQAATESGADLTAL